MKQTVHFERDGLTLVGNLFLPENFNQSGKYNAVIVQGSFTSVKEQMGGTYARKLATQGLVALAFDYSYYGESLGDPRQLESPDDKLQDLRAAAGFLSELPFVKAVGMIGICTSAGNAIELANAGYKIKALATVAAFLPSPDLYRKMYGDDGLAERKRRASEARRKYESTGEVDIVPAYSETDNTAINFGKPGSYDYYLNKSRGNVPQYKNEAAIMGLEQFLNFDPVAKASAVSTPTLVIHSDGCAFPEEAKRLYSELDGKKELVWADGTHFDYYDSEPQINGAVASIVRFFNAHLS